MKQYLSLLLMALLIASPISNSQVFAQDSQTSDVELIQTSDINYAKHLWFKSNILDEETSMNIYLPPSFHSSSKEHTYPIIFINGSHGNQFFLTLSGIVGHLSKLDRMPESIVVSLNYSGHFPDVYTNNMGWSQQKINGYGNPDKYIRHLTEELLPYLQQNYRANQQRTLIGVSGSSIFPLYVFARQPEIFQSYVFLAAMDVVGMGFTQQQTIIDEIVAAAKKTSSRSRLLYMGVADDDIAEQHEEIYVKNLKRLQLELAPYQSEKFTYVSKVFSGERHYDAFIKLMLNALESLYPEAVWAPKYRKLIAKPGDALDNIDAYYHMLSKKYGYKIMPKSDRWNSVNCLRFVAHKLLQDGRIKESIRVAERWTQNQPGAAKAFHQLAKSLQQDQQIKAAIVASSRAVDLAGANKLELSQYQQQLSLLKQHLPLKGG